MKTIYVETSIVGYLTVRSVKDVVFQARQELTRRWWQQRRQEFIAYTSQLVLDEAGAGDPNAAAERLRALDGMPHPTMRTDLPISCSCGTSCPRRRWLMPSMWHSRRSQT